MMRGFMRDIKERWVQLRSRLPSIGTKAEELEFKLLMPENAKKAKIGDTFELPRNRYTNIEAYLQKFYNSTSQNGRANGQNLAFVIGAENSGKTSLIKESIKTFKRRKAQHPLQKANLNQQLPFTTLSSPEYLQDLQQQTTLDNEYSLILQLDFSQENQLKPQALFDLIHRQILSQLLNLQKQVHKKTGMVLLDALLVRDIVLADNAMDYIFVYAKDVLWAILNETDGLRLTGRRMERLGEINDRVVELEGEDFFGGIKEEGKGNVYIEIVDLVAEEYKISPLQASIKFFLSVFKRIQYENRPELYTNRYYQTGIESSQFLFSLLNYLCGFGNLNKKTLQSHIETSQPIPTSSSFISKGNHIDILLTLTHIEKLSCYQHPKFIHWLDTLLIRLHNASNLRTHFPVVIQLADSWVLDRLQKCGRMEVDNPTVVEIPGYFVTNLYRYSPALVMNKKSLDRLKPVLGRNPSTWNQAILQLSQGTTLDQLTSHSSPFNNLHPQFLNKLNKLYLHPQNLPLIDTRTLQYHILEYLHIIDRCNGFMKTYYLQLNGHIFDNPLFSQFYTNGILYQSYYNLAVDLVDMRFLAAVRKEIRGLGVRERVGYRVWKAIQSPYVYWIKELRYRDDLEIQEYKKLGIWNQRSDYMVREYYGEIRDYRVSLMDRVYRQKYNL